VERKENHWDSNRDEWPQILGQRGVELRAWRKERDEEMAKYFFFKFSFLRVLIML